MSSLPHPIPAKPLPFPPHTHTHQRGRQQRRRGRLPSADGPAAVRVPAAAAGGAAAAGAPLQRLRPGRRRERERCVRACMYECLCVCSKGSVWCGTPIHSTPTDTKTISPWIDHRITAPSLRLTPREMVTELVSYAKIIGAFYVSFAFACKMCLVGVCFEARVCVSFASRNVCCTRVCFEEGESKGVCICVSVWMGGWVVPPLFESGTVHVCDVGAHLLRQDHRCAIGFFLFRVCICMCRVSVFVALHCIGDVACGFACRT